MAILNLKDIISLFHIPKEAQPSISIETRISYLKSRSKYFERLIGEQPLFQPEFEVSKEILEVIEAVGKIDENALVDIVNIYNKITRVAHYDGSGWFDFQLLLEGYFHHYGHSVSFEKDTGLMRIDKIKKST